MLPAIGASVGVVVWLVAGTLSGFEETSALWWWLFRLGCVPAGCPCVVGVGVVGWWFVENCIVDVSIFCVVKLLRADGGCLGTRGR